MATHVVRLKAVPSISSRAFDAVVAALSFLLVAGVYVDGWAHLHLQQLETFFTPWHGLMYSAYLALALVFVGMVLANRSRGLTGARAVPQGYATSIFGVGLFALGGVGDMIWHLLFGIEVDLEALLSPTHLLLAVGAGLMVTGPLRARWRDHDRGSSLQAFLPVVISVAALFSALAFMTQYLHPFGTTWAAASRRPEVLLGSQVPAGEFAGFSLASYFTFFEQVTGLAGVVLQTTILMGIVFTLLRRWTLPAGSLTAILTLNTVLMTLMRDRFLATGPIPLIVAAALAGASLDILVLRLRPSAARPAALRLFGFLAPVILYAFYFLTLWMLDGLWWRVHLWTGALALAGITGWLMSYLVVTSPQGAR